MNETGTAQPSNPRQARLAREWARLTEMNRESENVRAEPLNWHPGSEPERYKVTFLCKGIADIDPQTKEPIYQYKHEVEIYCDDDFPSEVPKLRWITPIWHPNIQHDEPKGVCVNKAEWVGAIGLDDLCRQMFEMVQYKNYHAEFVYPYPLDQKVAQWVREFAEPHGIVNKAAGKYVDDRPFVKPTWAGGWSLRFRPARGRARSPQSSRPQHSRPWGAVADPHYGTYSASARNASNPVHELSVTSMAGVPLMEHVSPPRKVRIVALRAILLASADRLRFTQPASPAASAGEPGPSRTNAESGIDAVPELPGTAKPRK